MRAPKPQTLGYYNTTLDYYTLNTNQVCHSTVYQEESIIYILICQMHPNCPHKHALPTRAWEISISTSIVGYYRNCIKTNQAHTRCNIDTGRFCNFLAKTHSMYSQNAILPKMELKQLIQTKKQHHDQNNRHFGTKKINQNSRNCQIHTSDLQGQYYQIKSVHA